MSMINTLIKYRLDNLNNENKGYALFENLGIEVVKKIYPEYEVFPSSGMDTGGDGGHDGYAIFKDQKYKIACSINKEITTKIQQEYADIKDKNIFDKLIFCTNQKISEKKITNLMKDYPKIHIVDFSKIVLVVAEHPDLQIMLDIPHEEIRLTIERMREQNQIQDEQENIKTYLKRDVVLKDNKTITLQEWADQAFNHSESKGKRIIKILDSPAGYGKTSALKKLFWDMLYNDKNVGLPPIYLDVKEYVPATLMTSINSAVALSGDYKLKDFYLLIDSIEDLPDDYVDTFLNELYSTVLINQSVLRCVLIAGRTGQYNKHKIEKKFKALNFDIETAHLTELNDKDRNKIILNFFPEFRCRKTCNEISTYFDVYNYADNVFYVYNTVLFWHEKQRAPKTTIELMDYLIEKEAILQHTSVHELKTAGYQMLFSMIFQENNEKTKLEFSHRNIMEYGAACIASKFPIETILRITRCSTYIIKQVSNFVGFLLNVLYERDQEKANSLFNTYLQNASNLSVLMQIEREKLNRAQRIKLFEEYTSYIVEQKISTNDISPFIVYFISDDVNFYLDEILKRIKKSNQEDQLYLFEILNVIINNNKNFWGEIADKITELLLYWCDNIDRINIRHLSFSLYCIRKSASALKESQILKLFNTLKKVSIHIEELGNICAFLINSIENLSDEQIIWAMEKYLFLSPPVEDNIFSGTSVISDGDITKSVTLVDFYGFAEFILEAIYKEKVDAIEIIQIVFNRINSFEISDYLVFFKFILKIGSCINSIDMHIASMIFDILNKHNFLLTDIDHASPLFEKKELRFVIYHLLHVMFIREDERHRLLDFFFILPDCFKSAEIYSGIKTVFDIDFDGFLEWYCDNSTTTKSSFSDTILESLPSKIINKLDKNERNQNQIRTSLLNYYKKLEKDYHIIFKIEDFYKEVEKIYSKIDSGKSFYGILREIENKEKYEFNKNDTINLFVIYCVRSMKRISITDFIKCMSNNYEKLSFFFLVSYLYSNYNYPIKFRLNSDHEKNLFADWFEKCFFDLENDGYCRKSIILALDKLKLENFVDEYIFDKNKNWWKAIVDNPVLYDNTAGRKVSLKFILDFVDISIVSNYVLAQSCDATENHDNKIVMCFDFFLENYDKIPDSIINRFRNRFIKYLNKNFRNSKLANGKLNEIIEIFEINIWDLNTEELENTVLETYYLSYHLITIGYIVFRKLVTVANINDLSRTILKDMFYRIKKIGGDDKIRCFVETFICYVHDDAEVNNWYITYIMNSGVIGKDLLFIKEYFFFTGLDFLIQNKDFIIYSFSNEDDKHKFLQQVVFYSISNECNSVLDGSKNQIKIDKYIKFLVSLCAELKNYRLNTFINDFLYKLELKKWKEENSLQSIENLIN